MVNVDELCILETCGDCAQFENTFMDIHFLMHVNTLQLLKSLKVADIMNNDELWKVEQA